MKRRARRANVQTNPVREYVVALRVFCKFVRETVAATVATAFPTADRNEIESLHAELEALLMAVEKNFNKKELVG